MRRKYQRCRLAERIMTLTYLLDPVKFGRDSSIMELAEQLIRDSYEEEMAIIDKILVELSEPRGRLHESRVPHR